MSRYEDLAKRLRERGEFLFPHHGEIVNEDGELMKRAADAIEALQKLAQKLLANYQEEATGMVWEYSGNIEQSLDWLEKRCADFQAQIDGDDIFPKTHEIAKKPISREKKI